jgi:1,4-alpha-glucan branching enzyme
MHLYKVCNHYEIYEKLGAHLTAINGHSGREFCGLGSQCSTGKRGGRFLIAGMAVPIRCESGSKQGSGKYSFLGLAKALITNTRFATAFGNVVLKSDPFSFFGQHGVQTASLVFNVNRFKWSDDEWVEERKTRYWPQQPVSIYEVHLASWARVPEENNRYLSYLEFADRLIPYVKEMGIHPYRITTCIARARFLRKQVIHSPTRRLLARRR